MLVQHRAAQVIPATDANAFFTDLAAKIQALERVDGPHPLSVAAATAAVKGHLEHGRPISLHDVVCSEAQAVRERMLDGSIWTERSEKTTETEAWLGTLRNCEAASDTLCHIVATTTFFGSVDSVRVVSLAVERLAESWQGSRYHLWQYPALRVMYSGGIAACAAKNMPGLKASVLDPVARVDGKYERALASLIACQLLDKRVFAACGLNQYVDWSVPSSGYLHDSLRDILRPTIPSDSEYTVVFDVFEALLSLIYLDAVDPDWAPIGQFVWRRDSKQAVESMTAWLKTDAYTSRSLGGLFGDDPSRVAVVEAKQEERLRNLRSSRW